MRKHILFFNAVVPLILFISSCKVNTLKGEGEITTSSVSVQPFSSIQIEVPLKANITVQPGVEPGVQLSSYANILKHIKTTVKDNILYITFDLDETWNMGDDSIAAQITLPAITALTLTGAPDADIHGNITGASFKLDISGAASVVIDNINVELFTSEVSGSADIVVKAGTVKKATYEISGAGDIEAFPLQTTETEASISGTGSGEVTALTKLSASISGAGTIKYKGHPSISQDVSGAGSITDAN